MKTYKRELIPAIEARWIEDGFEYLICDLCGAKSLEGVDDWGKRSGERREITIEFEDVNDWGDYSSGTITETDICPTCFKEKVRPTLESIGVVFRERDYGE